MHKVAAGLIVLVAVLVLATPAQVSSALQDATPTTVATAPTPTPPPIESSLLAHAALDALPAGPATITATLIELAPGTASAPFSSAGPTLVIVEDGVVSVDADTATVGVPNVSALLGFQQAGATPAAVAADVPEDWQILIPEGATATFRNQSAEPVSLLLVSIISQG